MDSKLRTILVGLISLAAVLSVYLLYSLVSKTPQIDVDPVAETGGVPGLGDFDSKVGEIGNVGIADLKKPVFRHVKNGRVDREFGFEEPLRELRDEWEIEKPYLNIYQRDFRCFITADKGKVQVEAGAGRPSLRDAIFTGNVVVHILPADGSDIKESSIYLDDVAFASEKSLFSSAGPVRFASQDAQMLGSGLELIYNDELERLELFRIAHLERLYLKSSQSALFATPTRDSEHPARPTTADDAQKPKAMPAPSQEVVEQGQYYKCVFSKNVVIDSPEQLVFAEDELCISNIFWPRASDAESSQAETANTDDVNSVSNPTKAEYDEEKKVSDWVKSRHATVSKQAEPDMPPEEVADIVVTCDNGVVIMPMNSAPVESSYDKSGVAVTAPDKKPLQNLDSIPSRTTFITRRIDYDVSTGDAVAVGPSELTFCVDVNDSAGAKPEKMAVPIKVTANKQTKFLSASNQVIFEGDCVCTMLQTEPNNIQQKYTLTAPRLAANLGSRATSHGARVEHLTADGGVVKLKSIKTAKGQPLGGVELECCRSEYDAGQDLFIATGPGMIKLNNAKTPEPNEQAGGFSLRRPCYAFLRDFATLTYFLKTKQIIADAEPGGTLQIDYFPVVAGKPPQHTIATAAQVKANLVQTADGQTELSALTASGTVTCKDKDNEFAGGELFYDHKKGIMKVRGDASEPCYYNGALVDEIEYDLKTGKVKFKVAGPGTLNIK